MNRFHYVVVIFLIAAYVNRNDVFAINSKYDQVLIPANAEWFYELGKKSSGSEWKEISFDDSNWESGKAGFGYGDEDDRTLLKSMPGQFDSLRIRHHFTVNDSGIIRKLYLYVRFDDAFTAYLNGVEIASSGISQDNSKRVIDFHEAEDYTGFSILNQKHLLKNGENILAIEGFNQSINSSDFSLEPVLTLAEVKNPGLLIRLSRDEQLQDMDYLEQRLEDQSSYLFLNKFDYKKEMIELKKSLVDDTSVIKFARKIDKYIARIGDAHARVKVDLDGVKDRYLPFFLADSSIGVLALTADQSEFIEPEYPILSSIDGIPLTQWLESAAKYIPQAAAQLIRYRSLRELRSIDRIRMEQGLIGSLTLDIILTSVDGEKHKKLTFNTSSTRLSSAKVRLKNSAKLPGNIGYLRIPSMYDSADDVIEAMTSFQHTDGLIIDVRDNRGGHYEILRALYGYFVAGNSSPYVANIAAYRLSPLFDSDFLEYRSSYRSGYFGWAKSEQAAIEKAMSVFKPQWQIPVNKFSNWHFMVLGKSEQSDQYYYNKPIVVICDSASFSATDVFLSVFSELPQVMTMGQPSSGGSGASRTIRLLNSGIEIAMSSMASFRPNGQLYDGNGVDVDTLVIPKPADFLGETDSVLDEALNEINRAIGEND